MSATTVVYPLSLAEVVNDWRRWEKVADAPSLEDAEALCTGAGTFAILSEHTRTRNGREPTRWLPVWRLLDAGGRCKVSGHGFATASDTGTDGGHRDTAA